MDDMAPATVTPGEISPPVDYVNQPEDVQTSSAAGSNKRARVEDDMDEDEDEDGFDPVFDQDSTYADPSALSGGSGSGAASPHKSRQRTVSNTSEARERKPIQIEYIHDKSRRHITFSKRKAGIMKKAYELSTLTGTQVLLLVVSETGLVYTFTTPKLSAIVNEDHGQRLIEACLAAEEGQQPAFADTDYGISEPSLTIKRSNGDRSPRRRQVSGQRPSTPGNDGRRTSARHAAHPVVPQSPPSGATAIPSPRRTPSNPHMSHGLPAMPSAQPQMPPATTEEHFSLYEQMAASSAAAAPHSLHAPMSSIPPYYTDGHYAGAPRVDPHHHGHPGQPEWQT